MTQEGRGHVQAQAWCREAGLLLVPLKHLLWPGFTGALSAAAGCCLCGSLDLWEPFCDHEDSC